VARTVALPPGRMAHSFILQWRVKMITLATVKEATKAQGQKIRDNAVSPPTFQGL
jgi:hypothetical protein